MRHNTNIEIISWATYKKSHPLPEWYIKGNYSVYGCLLEDGYKIIISIDISKHPEKTRPNKIVKKYILQYIEIGLNINSVVYYVFRDNHENVYVDIFTKQYYYE